MAPYFDAAAAAENLSSKQLVHRFECIFCLLFFAVFKMIGREHQARLELPSFGFSKVRNPYAITDHPKMMLYNYVLPHHTRCPAAMPHRGRKNLGYLLKNQERFSLLLIQNF